MVSVATVMPRSRKARLSPAETLGSAAGTRTAPASNTVKAAPKSEKREYHQWGADVVLAGEALVRSGNPRSSITEFIRTARLAS